MHLKKLHGSRGVINAFDYGARDGQVSGAAINNTISACVAERRRFELSPGVYGIETPIIYQIPMIGLSGVDGNQDTGPTGLTILQPTTTMAAVIDIGNVPGWWIQDICIEGGGVNAIGIRALGSGGGTTNYPSRYRLTRVRIRGLANVGADLHGWMGEIYDCYMDNNTGVCLLLREGNAVTVRGGEYRAAASGWGIDIYPGIVSTKSSKIQIDTTVESVRSGANGLKIREKCTNIEVRGYFEGHAGAKHLEVGYGGTGAQADAVLGLDIRGTYFTGNTSTIHLDNVIGVDSSGSTTTGPVITTANTRNVRALPVPPPGTGTRPFEYYSLKDGGKRIGRPSENLLVNPNFKGGARGFIQVDTQNVTVSEETTITRNGESSLKVMHPNGGASGTSRLVLYPPCQTYLADVAAGKRIVFGCWLYLPNTTAFAAGTLRPAINMRYTDNGSIVQGTGVTLTYNAVIDDWQFMHCWIDVIAVPVTGLSLIGVSISPTNSGADPGADQPVYIADAFFCVDPQSIDDLMHGRYSPSRHGGVMVGSSILLSHTAAPTDADTQWLKGDKVENPDAGVGTFDGWRCTTAGTGASATFKQYGVIAA